MVAIGMTSYPAESSKEMARRFMEIPPLPTYITRKGPYFGSELGVGIKTIAIYEYDPSKMAEAAEYIGNSYARFIGVPGFTYTVGTWLEAKEALKRIGLALNSNDE
jgi:hypothetical protein